MNWKRSILAVALTALVAAVFAWWIKGDWEMGWLIWLLVLPIGGGVLGLGFGLILRGGVLLPPVAGSLVGGLALWVAMVTPHRWEGPDRAAAERREAELRRSPAVVEARAREALQAGVEISGFRSEVYGGWVHKRPFAFLPDHEPADVRLVVTFALGPDRGLTLRLEGDSLVADPASLDSARTAPWDIRQSALERRFHVPALRVGGSRPWMPGDTIAIRLERGGSDWSFLLVRVGGAEGLEPIREISRDETLPGLFRAAAQAGRDVYDVRIYFTPHYRGITYQPDGRFDFVGLPVDRRANLRLVGRLKDGEFRYETVDWFDR